MFRSWGITLTDQAGRGRFIRVQDGLDAVPDDRGGHRVIVRPDHYWEPNLSVPFKGAAGSYNLLIGDIEGSLGSGAQGWVVLRRGRSRTGFQKLGLVGQYSCFHKKLEPMGTISKISRV